MTIPFQEMLHDREQKLVLVMISHGCLKSPQREKQPDALNNMETIE